MRTDWQIPWEGFGEDILEDLFCRSPCGLLAKENLKKSASNPHRHPHTKNAHEKSAHKKRTQKSHKKSAHKNLHGVGLSGPLRLRVQSRSRTRLRIAASIAFLFRACFQARLSPPSGLERGGSLFLPPVFGCAGGVL